MSRTYRYPQRRAGRCHPRLERLENRLALSSVPSDPLEPPWVVPSSFTESTPSTELGPFLTIVSTDPGPSDLVNGALTEVSVEFDRPIDPWSIGVNDVVIQVERDGAWVAASDELSPPMESVDATGTRLILTPSAPLGPGRYRLVLPTGSLLMGADYSMLEDPGYDQVLGEFSIAQEGVTLDDALAVDGVGGAPILVAGSLDLATNPGAVQVYRFEVPEGHHWRFGAEVVAQSIGSSLQSTLALFDAQGRLLASSSHGRPSAPNDAYLFAGLEPGTYYVAVSGYGNVPGLPGGYDLVSGTVGTSGTPQPGGDFQLALVADPADSAVRFLGFQLNWADRQADSPTSLTLTFSGLLDIDSLRGAGAPGFAVVGEDGASHPIALVALNEPAAQYQFLFDEPLPVGRYTIRVLEGGATDLAGFQPVGERGGAILAAFTVAARETRPADPYDLGALYSDIETGRSYEATIDPGTAVTYRLVVISEGLYSFGVTPDGPIEALSMRLHGKPGQNVFDLTPPQEANLYLDPGVYYLQLTNHGSAEARLAWQVKQQTPWDSLLEHGVDQGSALNMRLVQRSDATSSASPPIDLASGPLGAPATPGQGGVGLVFGPYSGNSSAGTSGSPSGSVNASNSGATVAPGGLVLTLGNMLVGRPTADADHVAAVGPGPNGAVALAANGQGILQGIGVGQSTSDGRLISGEEIAPGEVVPQPAPTTDAPEVATSEAPVDGAMVGRTPTTTVEDESIAAVAADWMARFGRSAINFFTPGTEETPTAETPIEARAEEELLAQAPGEPRGDLEGKGRVEEANFDAPLVVGLVSVMAMRYHQPVLHWVRKHTGKPTAARHRGTSVPARGPHTRI
ncbi:MAG: hypothetical protein U0794_20455 [Isosphaeraceae bacterium]